MENKLLEKPTLEKPALPQGLEMSNTTETTQNATQSVTATMAAAQSATLPLPNVTQRPVAKVEPVQSHKAAEVTSAGVCRRLRYVSNQICQL